MIKVANVHSRFVIFKHNKKISELTRKSIDQYAQIIYVLPSSRMFVISSLYLKEKTEDVSSFPGEIISNAVTYTMRVGLSVIVT